ncbi:MAG: DUF1846 family protein, partial [Lachnospiraceae bacterium]|nr:DUF1846 family protein [Lachnospiraceae bacterium]
DVEIFPVLRAIFESISGESPYKSPTDMGVNMAGYCIFDDEAVTRAANDEIIRRYYITKCDERKGFATQDAVRKIEYIMRQADLKPEDRAVVTAALKKAEVTGTNAAAMELPDGTIITGKQSSLFGACAAMLLNALKSLAMINDSINLLSPVVIEPLQHLKVDQLGNQNPRLHTNEVLIALAICAATNETAKLALDQLPKLRGCEVHSDVILSQVDVDVFRKLGMNLTCEPKFPTNLLYQK